jgi:hypothetical protein
MGRRVAAPEDPIDGGSAELNRVCELAIIAALGLLLLITAVQPATGASAGLCNTAERHDRQWQTLHRKLVTTWASGNYERAAVVAGSMAAVARGALEDARSAPARRSGERAFRARIIAVRQGQRAAAGHFVDAMVAASAGRAQAAGRSYAQANVTLPRAGFVGDYC